MQLTPIAGGRVGVACCVTPPLIDEFVPAGVTATVWFAFVGPWGRKLTAAGTPGPGPGGTVRPVRPLQTCAPALLFSVQVWAVPEKLGAMFGS